MNYVYMIIGGLLGILLYSFRKVKGMRKRMRKEVTQANLTWKQTFIMYWEKDLASIALSFTFILTLVFVLAQIATTSAEAIEKLHFSPKIQWWIDFSLILSRAIFVFVGFFANSIIDAFAGRAEYVIDREAKHKDEE